jgi:hypothetical protein
MSLGSYRGAGSPSFARKAKDRALALIGSHDSRPPDGVMEEVERIYGKAVERVRSAGS